MIKKILLSLLAILVIIQFIHPEKNKSEGPQLNHISQVHAVPADVKLILEKGCYDCHSNNTKYPWYAKIQPVDWWLDKHVRDGKKELNFDEYSHRPLRYQYHKMEEVVEMVDKKEMPLKSYTWTHKDAILTGEEIKTLTDWAKGLMASMEAVHPIDSLKPKR